MGGVSGMGAGEGMGGHSSSGPGEPISGNSSDIMITESPMRNAECISLPFGPGRREISTAPNALT